MQRTHDGESIFRMPSVAFEKDRFDLPCPAATLLCADGTKFGIHLAVSGSPRSTSCRWREDVGRSGMENQRLQIWSVWRRRDSERGQSHRNVAMSLPTYMTFSSTIRV